MKHHEFSPSKLARLVACPGSYQMTRFLPSTGGSAADEGTMLHNAVATRSRDGLDAEQEGLFFACFEFLKRMEINDAKNAKIWNAEYPVTVKDETGNVLTEGTTDLIVQNDSGLTIVDWKFGRTPVASAEGNWQLAAYAAGAMQATGAESCRAAIFQPRLNAFSEYTFTNRSAIVRNIKRIISRATRSDVIELHMTSECRYCPAAAICPHLRAQAADLMGRNALDDLSGNALSELYETATILRNAADAVEEAVKARCDRDGVCGQWHWTERAGSSECTDVAGMFAAMKDYMEPTEIVAAMKVSRNKLRDAFIADAQGADPELTKKEAGERFDDLTADLFIRKPGTRVLVKGNQDAN